MDKCSDHALGQLRPSEKLTFSLATEQVSRGNGLLPGTATALLLIIQRLEHQLAHAHHGGIDCDNQSWPE